MSNNKKIEATLQEFFGKDFIVEHQKPPFVEKITIKRQDGKEIILSLHVDDYNDAHFYLMMRP